MQQMVALLRLEGQGRRRNRRNSRVIELMRGGLLFVKLMRD